MTTTNSEGIKLCVACKYMQYTMSDLQMPGEGHLCLKYVKSKSLVTGYVTYNLASEARDSENLCGKSAKYFEPKPIRYIEPFKAVETIYDARVFTSTQECNKPEGVKLSFWRKIWL